MCSKAESCKKACKKCQIVKSYEQDDGKLTDEQIKTIKALSTASDTQESSFEKRLF